MSETAEEYENETFRILMGDKKYPKYGYRPIELRKRILTLLEREERTRMICKKSLFYKMNTPCPFCGWTHV